MGSKQTPYVGQTLIIVINIHIALATIKEKTHLQCKGASPYTRLMVALFT
ncbi:hypothetical protein ACLEE6_10575 [Lonsdalea quercina]